MHRYTFVQNILPILALALFGGFFSCFSIAFLMYLFAWAFTNTGWTFIESLIFGSIISSTDPITVLSLLPITADKNLYMIILGESALNDAVSVILYRFFVDLQIKAVSMSLSNAIYAITSAFFGSMGIGIFYGLLCSKITKHPWIKVNL